MKDMKKVMQTLQIKYTDSTGKSDWGRVYESMNQPVLKRQIVDRQSMPDVRGMGLKDALYLLENMNVRVDTRGIGKVKMQSIEPGRLIIKNQIISLDLN
jgi:cell division protein FtsI (penicillin-binding protein 3)